MPALLVVTVPDSRCTSCTKTFVTLEIAVPVLATFNVTLKVVAQAGLCGLRAIPFSSKLGVPTVGVGLGWVGSGGGATNDTALKSPDATTTDGAIQPITPSGNWIKYQPDPVLLIP